jgi:DNA-binding Xre family transcriptional regulator
MDIVTSDRSVIYEVKHRLTRKAIQQATGQITLYRVSLNTEARAIIVGYATAETAALRSYVEALGIEIICWQDATEGEEQALELAASVPTSDPLHSSPSLHWQIQQVARAHDLASVRELAFHTQINRQSLYPIWNGISKSVSLAMLARLSATLEADPGGWFRRQGNDLIWNVRSVAESTGLTMQDVVWRAEILPHSLAAIWRGEQQFVSVITLEKLARALSLDTGDLFEWRGED